MVEQSKHLLLNLDYPVLGDEDAPSTSTSTSPSKRGIDGTVDYTSLLVENSKIGAVISSRNLAMSAYNHNMQSSIVIRVELVNIPKWIRLAFISWRPRFIAAQ